MRLILALPFVVACSGCFLTAPDRPVLVPEQDKAEAEALAPIVEQNLANGDVDSAAERSRLLVRYDPVTPRISVLAARGIAAKAQRDGDARSYEEAVKLAKNALEAMPRDADAQLTYADLQLGRKYYTAALAAYRATLGIDSKRMEALRGVALSHRGLREPKAERAAWEDVLSAAPDDAKANARLGLMLLQGTGGDGTADDAERGAELLARAVAADPNDAMTLQVLAMIEAERGDLDAAESHLRRAALAATGQPGEVDAVFNLAVILQQRGRANEARGLYERCLLLDSSDKRATTNLGFLLLDAGVTKQGRAMLNQAIALGVDKPTEKLIRERLGGEDAP